MARRTRCRRHQFHRYAINWTLHPLSGNLPERVAGDSGNLKTKFQKRFEELPFEEQTRFLETMEAGKMEGKLWEKGLDRQFFRLIRDHSLQGFYGSPRHGGNKNNVSYKMMRLDYPVIIGQNRYNN